MSTLQLASDTTGKLVVEWNKYAPHYRVGVDGGAQNAYHSEEAAMRAAKRLCKKLGLTLKLDRYSNPIPYKLMAKEFPDYEQISLPLIPQGWEESSWHNDSCPSFVIGETGLQVYLDYPKPEDRELQGGHRYCVLKANADGSVQDLGSSDVWSAVLAIVREHQA